MGFAQNPEIKTDLTHQLKIFWGGQKRLQEGSSNIPGTKPSIFYKIHEEVILFSASGLIKMIKADTILGMSFKNPSYFNQGMAIWRYKPWNSWTMPLKINSVNDLPADDIQFYYWQYKDGVYGAAVPLSGKGFRTTIGRKNDEWGSRLMSIGPNPGIDSLYTLAVAFGKNPFELFDRIYRVSLQSMEKGENLRVKKTFPEPFNYIGWCTWNASDNGKNLNESLLLKAAKSFKDKKFPLGWILVDDGWFQSRGGQLQSLLPDQHKFPNGFKPVIDKLKKDYGIKYVGVWHALNWLWNGIDPDSPLGKSFNGSLFSWQQKERPDVENAPLKKYYFIKPGNGSINLFYDNWHKYFKQQGFDFVKVDNQLVTEKMALNNFPLFTLSDSIHKALYHSANKYFDGAVINCMGMTAEAYLNFGTSAVARSVEDYFPYKPGENYNLKKGNAAAHVVQAVYNSIYFGQMVYPDFDLFQSHNPNAVYHAIARAINNGPVYITDNIGKQNLRVLWPLIYKDGKIIKSETPLLPTEDCLFQLQENKPFKAFSKVRNAGLLGVWNAADADSVKGYIKAGDINNIKGDQFIIYEYFSKTHKITDLQTSIPVKLGRMAYRLYYIIPIEDGFAPLGLIQKYNAPATILKIEKENRQINISLHEGGAFEAYCAEKPILIAVNGKRINEFEYKNGILHVDIPDIKNPLLTINLK